MLLSSETHLSERVDGVLSTRDGVKRAELAIVSAALVGSAATLWLVLTSTHTDAPALVAAMVLLIGWSFVVTGLLASRRLPGSRFGLLMSAVGVTVFLNSLAAANDSVPFTIGLVLGNVYLGLFIHALLSFPTGCLCFRLSRATVVASYAALTLGQVGALLVDDLESECAACPDNALLVAPSERASTAIDSSIGVFGVLVFVSIIVTLARRWRRATPPLRRALAPVLSAGGMVVVALALLVVTGLAVEGVADALYWPAVASIAAFPYAFLAGLVRSRLARAAVGRLVVELDGTPEEAEVREALRKALHDPSLRIAYWRPDTGRYVDGGGRAVDLPDGRDGRTATLIERKGQPVAALIHDAFVDHDPELVEAVAAVTGLALENERLQAELRARVAELRASRARILEAHGTERRRLERNLHDGAQQRLVTLGLRLRLADEQLADDPARARDTLRDARDELTLAVVELRELARGLHPAVLTARGLGPALETLALRAPLPVEITADVDHQLPEAVEEAAYYLVSEALTNVAKYASASRASIEVRCAGGRAIVEVADDGVGGADPARGSGIRGLFDRIETLDGRLEISSPRGSGTRIRAEIPYAIDLVAEEAAA